MGVPTRRALVHLQRGKSAMELAKAWKPGKDREDRAAAAADVIAALNEAEALEIAAHSVAEESSATDDF